MNTYSCCVASLSVVGADGTGLVAVRELLGEVDEAEETTKRAKRTIDDNDDDELVKSFMKFRYVYVCM